MAAREAAEKLMIVRRFHSIPFDSIRFGSIRFGSARRGSARSSSVQFGPARFGPLRLAPIPSDPLQSAGGDLATINSSPLETSDDRRLSPATDPRAAHFRRARALAADNWPAPGALAERAKEAASRPAGRPAVRLAGQKAGRAQSPAERANQAKWII